MRQDTSSPHSSWDSRIQHIRRQEEPWKVHRRTSKFLVTGDIFDCRTATVGDGTLLGQGDGIGHCGDGGFCGVVAGAVELWILAIEKSTRWTSS
jgi:hypothetical protein